MPGLCHQQSLCGAGGSDFVDALTVAADLIHKKIEVVAQLAKDNILKRVVLISNFQHAVRPSRQYTLHTCCASRHCSTIWRK